MRIKEGQTLAIRKSLWNCLTTTPLIGRKVKAAGEVNKFGYLSVVYIENGKPVIINVHTDEVEHVNNQVTV